MEITKREVIASITIIALWICLGFLIAGRIDTWQQDKNAEYDRAARIEDADLFQHGMSTNLGNAFVYGELQAVDPVTYSEIDGEYSYVHKIKERYTMHTREVTKIRTIADGKTETYIETEIYWSWDEVDRDSRKAETFLFLKNTFSADMIQLPAADYLETVKQSHDVRYVFYGVPDQMKGTMYTKLANGTISEKSKFYNDLTIEETVKMLDTEGYTIIFWILWIVVLVAVVYGFYYLDNDWLND